jgi:hypothetical protein
VTERGGLLLVPVGSRRAGPPRQHGTEGPSRLGFLTALALGLAPLASLAFHGLYDLTAWGPVALVTYTVLVAMLVRQRLVLSREAQIALAAAFGFTAWAALSALWAPAVGRAWTEANRLAFYTALFAAALASLRSERVLKFAWAVLGVTMGFLAVYAAVSMLVRGGNGWFVDFRLEKPLGYINANAALFLTSFWVLLSYAEGARSLVMRVGAFACAVLSLALIVLTQSRAVVPALAVATFVVLALVPGRTRRAALILVAVGGMAMALPWLLDVYAERVKAGGVGVPSDAVVRRAALAALGGAVVSAAIAAVLMRALERSEIARQWSRYAVTAVVALAAVAALVRFGDPIADGRRAWDTFTSLQVRQDATTRFTDVGGYRYDLWRIAWDQFKSDPVKGVGAGNYDLTYFRERRTPPFVRQPHSIEMQTLGELGVVGALLLGSVIAAIATGAARMRSRRPELAALAPAAVGAGAVWVVQASVDWLHLLPAVTAVGILSAATMLATRPQEGAATARRGMRQSALVVAAVVLTALAAASVGRQWASAHYLGRAEAALPEHPGKAIAEARRSISLNRYDPLNWYALSAAYARRNDYPRARRALLAAADTEPFNYVPWVLMGDLAVRKGYIATARVDYARAHQLDPFDPLLTP